MHRITVIDSHTGGEPTRVVVSGGPDLGPGAVADKARVFRERFDHFRSAVVNEPRGSDVLVGALLCEPREPGCAAGVIFFNNVGVLGMCGHGTIGLAVTLAHLGRIGPGEHRIETPVGVVTATLHDRNRVTVRNVPSYRHRKGVTVEVPGLGPVTGDVAWGGNWFFLTADHGQELRARNVERLTAVSWAVRRALESAGVTGADGGVIDHIELVGPPGDPANHARNFVLCPGGAYDRSPCGTGTSAKLACLFADGKLKPGEVWRQESVIGSVFEGRVELAGGPESVLPSITGTAHVTAEAMLLLDPADPLRDGIGSTVPPKPTPKGTPRMSEPTPPPPAQPLRPGIDFKKKLTVSKIIASYADSYTDAAAELWESGLRRNSPSIPSLVLAAFAVEVYLKAFNSKPKFDPDAFGPGFVETHEYIGRRSHKLPDLYDMIPEPARADLAGRYVGAGFRTAETLRGILAEFEGVFVDVRYLHEPREKDPLPVRPDELIRLAQFFKELSQSVPEYPGTVRL